MQLLSPGIVKFLVVAVICLGMYRMMEAGGLLGADKELLNYRMYRTVNSDKAMSMDRTTTLSKDKLCQIHPKYPNVGVVWPYILHFFTTIRTKIRLEPGICLIL